jgi:hypothetical protein
MNFRHNGRATVVSKDAIRESGSKTRTDSVQLHVPSMVRRETKKRLNVDKGK